MKELNKSSIIVVLSLLLCLCACEAPLDLSGIHSEEKKSVLRFDQFQAAGRNDNAIVVVGAEGVVLTSSDGGKSWFREALEGKPALIDLAVCPDQSVAILDFEKQVWLSFDDGYSWSQHALPTEEIPQAITCDSRGHLWVVGSFSTILSSKDSGSNWQVFSMNEDTIFTTVQFVNDKQGIVFGEFGTFLSTSDGGSSWKMENPLPNEFYPQSAFFKNRQVGWITGLNGVILHTKNGGLSWEKQSSDSKVPLYGIADHNNSLFVVGDHGVLLTNSGMAHWHSVPYDETAPSYLRNVLSISKDEILLVGGAGTVRLLSLDKFPEVTQR